MNNLPRQKLQEIVIQYGDSVYHEHKLCKALLKDFCGQYRKEISVLVGALEEGIPAQLLASKNTVPHAVLIAQLIKKLQDNLGLTEAAARWAVESWVLALGVISTADTTSVDSSPPPHVLPQYQQEKIHQPPTPPIDATPQEEERFLQSQRGIDYTRLKDLLVAKSWKEADIETRQLMLKAADREKQGWFDSDSIQKFSCEDLHVIDKLWLKHSNKRFGFSVQKNIYQNYKTPEKSNSIIWNEFATKLGYKTKDDEWLKYDELSFSLSSSRGYLPTTCYTERLYIVSWYEGVATNISRVLNLFFVVIFHKWIWSLLTGTWFELVRLWEWLWSSSYWLATLTQNIYILFILVKIVMSLTFIVICGIALCFIVCVYAFLTFLFLNFAAAVIALILQSFLDKDEDNVLDKFFNRFLQCNL